MATSSIHVHWWWQQNAVEKWFNLLTLGNALYHKQQVLTRLMIFLNILLFSVN